MPNGTYKYILSIYIISNIVVSYHGNYQLFDSIPTGSLPHGQDKPVL